VVCTGVCVTKTTRGIAINRIDFILWIGTKERRGPVRSGSGVSAVGIEQSKPANRIDTNRQYSISKLRQIFAGEGTVQKYNSDIGIDLLHPRSSFSWRETCFNIAVITKGVHETDKNWQGVDIQPKHEEQDQHAGEPGRKTFLGWNPNR